VRLLRAPPSSPHWTGSQARSKRMLRGGPFCGVHSSGHVRLDLADETATPASCCAATYARRQRGRARSPPHRDGGSSCRLYGGAPDRRNFWPSPRRLKRLGALVLMTWLPATSCGTLGNAGGLTRMAELLPAIHDAGPVGTTSGALQLPKHSDAPPSGPLTLRSGSTPVDGVHGPITRRRSMLIPSRLSSGNVLVAARRLPAWSTGSRPVSASVGRHRPLSSELPRLSPGTRRPFTQLAEQPRVEAFHPWEDIGRAHRDLDGLRDTPTRPQAALAIGPRSTTRSSPPMRRCNGTFRQSRSLTSPALACGSRGELRGVRPRQQSEHVAGRAERPASAAATRKSAPTTKSAHAALRCEIFHHDRWPSSPWFDSRRLMRGVARGRRQLQAHDATPTAPSTKNHLIPSSCSSHNPDSCVMYRHLPGVDSATLASTRTRSARRTIAPTQLRRRARSRRRRSGLRVRSSMVNATWREKIT